MGAMDPEVNVSRPVSARVWNYWLGGKDHYAVDRRAGDEVARHVPGIAAAARADRQFLGRVMAPLVHEGGIRQFLDVGTGLPTADNTHEMAQRLAPDARIVYVDNDPLVLSHARALLTSTPEGATSYVDADARDPEKILEAAAATLDLDRPVALMLLAILHLFTDDAEAARIVGTLVDALPSGSYLVLTHACLDVDATRTAMRVWNGSGTPHPIRARGADRITGYFDGLDLLEPGVVSCSRWRPLPNRWGLPDEVMTFGGVARKP
ncbi:SAM-dependent methyltransferase [Actinomadura rayongensis]|uniref:SAM-dependent methyltransferase n=2 Tax=Actinomadura rayongensis TaxID=1429076 RepID=A0A6I4WH89_9ACTN|nr:SAM-dependent methyltransferase [Actinomadura rayongensis]